MIKIKKIRVMVPLICLTCFSACAPVPYANVGTNVPLLKNKGEVNLNAGYGATDDAEGFGLQIGAAVSSSVGVIGSLYLMSESKGSEWKGNGSYYEFGAGKFGSSKNGKFIYDAYIGLGFGGVNNKYESSHLDVKFMKPFIQGSVGFTHRIIDIALTPRFALVNYTDHSFNFDDPLQSQEAEAFFNDNKTKFVFEPALTIRVGYESVRLSLQTGISTFSERSESENVNINNQFVGIGVNFLIGNRWNK